MKHLWMALILLTQVGTLTKGQNIICNECQNDCVEGPTYDNTTPDEACIEISNLGTQLVDGIEQDVILPVVIVRPKKLIENN